MSLAAKQGEEITILVEGMDDEARRLVLQLYSALSSEDSYALDFTRFEP